PEDPESVAASAFEGAVREEAERASQRLSGLLARIAVAGAEADRAPPDPRVALDVARRALRLGGGASIPRERDWVLVLDDDDRAGRGDVLADAGRRAGVPVTVVRLPRGPPPGAASPGGRGWTLVVRTSIPAWKRA